MLPRLGSSDRRQAEGIIEMALPEPFLLPRSQEAELDSLGIGLLQELHVVCAERRTPRRMVAVAPMFHVKR